LTVCPTAVFAAPVERVWESFVRGERYSHLSGGEVERNEPEGSASVGQTRHFVGKAFGRRRRFICNVEEHNRERYQLGIHVRLPLGLREKPHIACNPIDATSCRVQYG